VARICEKEKRQLIGPFFSFFFFQIFDLKKLEFFLLEEAHFTVKETCLFPKKRKKKPQNRKKLTTKKQ
jgi:hypothetical protein